MYQQSCFSWIGAMSHMFGDMSTREGVYLSGVAALIANNRTKVKIVPTFIIKPFGNFVDTSQWFSTDSNWEISFRQAVNIVIYVLAGVNILYFLGNQCRNTREVHTFSCRHITKHVTHCSNPRKDYKYLS